MTNEEAIDGLKRIFNEHELDLQICGIKQDSLVIRDMAISAIEKQIAKKPKRNNTIASKFFHKTSCYTCPTCGNGLLTKMMTERQDTRFCWDCGQKLDWTEEKKNEID